MSLHTFIYGLGYTTGMSNTTTRMIEMEGQMLTRKEYKALPICERHMGRALKVYATGEGFVCKSCIAH